MKHTRFFLILFSLFLPAIVSASEFYFVQLTDTHWSIQGHAKRLKKAVKMINQLPMDIDFTVITGDIASDNLLNAAFISNHLKIIAELDMPVYTQPGNHDILSRQLSACIDTWTNYFHPLSFSITHKDTRLIFLFAENIREKYLIPGYTPLDWLEKELSAAPGIPVILFQHSPPVMDFYNNNMHQDWPQEYLQRFSLIIQEHPVKALICGHFHRDELHWTGPVPVFVSSSIAGFWGRQASFRIWHYQDGRLSYRTVYIED